MNLPEYFSQKFDLVEDEVDGFGRNSDSEFNDLEIIKKIVN
jgi:hypothetical protein